MRGGYQLIVDTMSWNFCGTRIIGAIRNLPARPPIVFLQEVRVPKEAQWTTAHRYIAFHAKMRARESGVAVVVRMHWAKKWSTSVFECERQYVAAKMNLKDTDIELELASIYLPPRGSRYYNQEWTEAAMTKLKETDISG